MANTDRLTVRVSGRSFRYDDSRYRSGETFEIPAESDLLERYPRTLERVAADTDTDSESDDGGDSDSDGDGDGDGDDDEALASMSHEALKDLAEERGIADEVDLRRKDEIIEALEAPE